MPDRRLDTSLDQRIRLDIPGGGDYFLTTYREDDIEAMVEAFQHAAVLDELISVPKPYTHDTARFWLDSQLAAARTLLPLSTIKERNNALFNAQSELLFRQIPIQIIRHNDLLIGCCSVSPASCTPPIGELGYWLHPKYHGKRIMQVATRALIKYAANEFGVKRVIGRAEGGNVASQKIIERLANEVGSGTVVEKWGKEKWPENKKGGEVRDLVSWEWSIKPDEGFEVDLMLENLV